MTITLSKHDYQANECEIHKCLRGMPCKIMSSEHMLSNTTTYHIDTDVLSGWPFHDETSYHGKSQDECWIHHGLGVFILIQQTETEDGKYILEFTDDLNPDLK